MRLWGKAQLTADELIRLPRSEGLLYKEVGVLSYLAIYMIRSCTLRGAHTTMFML